jgi:hypothetical protein
MVVPGPNNNLIVGLVRREQLESMPRYMPDEKEFLSPYGIRSVSKYHRDHPLELDLGGQIFRLDYEPGESQTSLFGGNSNWRGPIWMPVNFLIVLALSEYHKYYGDSLRVECPTGSGRFMNLAEVVNEIASRLGNLFLRDRDGHRAIVIFFRQIPTGGITFPSTNTSTATQVAAVEQAIRPDGQASFRCS